MTTIRDTIDELRRIREELEALELHGIGSVEWHARIASRHILEMIEDLKEASYPKATADYRG